MLSLRALALTAAFTLVKNINALPYGPPVPVEEYGPGLFGPTGLSTAAAPAPSPYSEPTAAASNAQSLEVLTTTVTLTSTTTIPVATVSQPVPTLSPTEPEQHAVSNVVTSSAIVTPTPYVSATQPSTSSTVVVPTPYVSAPQPSASMLRGVNIGGWLVLEPWLNSDLFDGSSAKDQLSFDSQPGAIDKLRQHWSTFFTEADVAKIASWGINALRIPIGYWAYNAYDTKYQTGADEYLEKAIGWARTHGLQVLIDCHGSPGSQNGFDNSGQAMDAGAVTWQDADNLQKSIDVLVLIAKKYGGQDYADVVWGIELVNEPIFWGANNFEVTKSWAQKAHDAVRSASSNQALHIVMHDSFKGASEWQTVGHNINSVAEDKSSAKFVVDVHLYQNQVASDSLMTQEQHIARACQYKATDLAAGALPVIVGEFSAATNICVNPDNSTVAGNVCVIDGCQCSANVPIEQWHSGLIGATRKFLEAELDAFEATTQGWFMWNYKGPGAWGLDNAVKYGLVGAKVTDRMYPGQCDH